MGERSPGLPPDGNGHDPAGWRDFGPAAILLILGVLGLAVATLAPSGEGGQYAVVAPPWYSLRQTIALVEDADGAVADTGGPANIVVAYSEKPGFVGALYGAGAWLVIDPLRLRGCLGFRPTTPGEGA